MNIKWIDAEMAQKRVRDVERERDELRAELVDVKHLLIEYQGVANGQSHEIQRLLVDNAELSAECDQWQKKVASCWREIEQLRAASQD